MRCRTERPGRESYLDTVGVQQVDRSTPCAPAVFTKGTLMNRIIYIIGAVVVIIALLSFFGLR